jgi:hypothetical protein
MMNAKTVKQDVSKNPKNWNENKLNQWFQKGEWRLEWNIIPDESINKTELAIQFFKNRELWGKAFNFLKTFDLKKFDTGKYELEGKNLYVIVDEHTTRNEEDSCFEAHRRYIDIQYIVEGEENIGISALKNTKEITPYISFVNFT